MAEEKNNVTRLTQDATLGEKMKLVAGLYAKKMGRAVDNSAPFQMARDVRDSWRDFKGDMRDMGQAIKDEFNQTRKSMRVRRKLAVRWMKKAPRRALNWTGRKIKQGARWLGNKAKEIASKQWNKFKQTKFAKNVAKRYTQVKNFGKAVGRGIVKTGIIIATPAIVTYKAVNQVYNNTKNWFNEKAEVAARLQERSANKPNEQIQEAMEQNVNSDAVNETVTRGAETETQKQVEAAVVEEQSKGENSDKTVESQQEQHTGPTLSVPEQEQVPLKKAQEIPMTPNNNMQQNQEQSPLSTIASKKWDALQKATDKLKTEYDKCVKAGRPQEAERRLAAFEERLTSPEKQKGNFHLSEEQAQAFKKSRAKDFEAWRPKTAQSHSSDENQTARIIDMKRSSAHTA